MYCSKCGTEMPEGAKFCKECGASVEPKQKKKRLPIGIVVAAVIVVATVTVGVCFATGVIGGQGGEEVENVVETGKGTPRSVVTEATEAPTPQPTADLAAMAKEASEAYQAYIQPEIDAYKEYKEEHERYEDNEDYLEATDGEWGDEDMEEPEYDPDVFDAGCHNTNYILFYLDEDDYPELICGTGERRLLMTYKNGKVFSYDVMEEEIYPNIASGFGELAYKERERLIYSTYSLKVTVGVIEPCVSVHSFKDNKFSTVFYGHYTEVNEESIGEGESVEDYTDGRATVSLGENSKENKVSMKKYEQLLSQYKGNDSDWTYFVDGDYNELEGSDSVGNAYLALMENGL